MNNIKNNVGNNLITSKQNTGAYEIANIFFIGNNNFTEKELLDNIASKPTHISIPNKVLSTYYNESSRNEYVPQTYIKQLHNSLAQFSNEYHYFNKEIVESDVEALMNLYNINGFHKASIYYNFGLDSSKKKNILSFYITENKQYHLADAITYIGLDSLPEDVKFRFDTLRKIKKGEPFNEVKIEREIKSIHSLLLRTGFMYAK
jgi:outer membrane protein assembly factor BamA